MDPYMFEIIHLFVDIGQVGGQLEDVLGRIASRQHPGCTYGKSLNLRVWCNETDGSSLALEHNFSLLSNALRALRSMQSLAIK